jgi:plasmid stabilization system protein ParE
MTQLGEGVAVGIFIPSSDTAHSESTCPWHGPAEEGSAKPMEKQACDEDGHAPIPPNLGEKLGKNLDAAKRAVHAIRQGVKVLGQQPGVGRPIEDMPDEFREWIIDFGDSGYAARYRIDSDAVTILAVRHQKEVGY